MKLDVSQEKAIELAGTGKDCLITGGAGTGKTTIIKNIADERKVIIVAPTGKAAARLKEATGHYAETIHRMLGWDGDGFLSDDPIDKPVVIDESSMVDSWLLARVMERNPPQVVLVGDAAQLPPVGRGQPFHDLLKLRPERCAKLERCYRSQAAVHKAAQAIRNGNGVAREEISGGESWKMEDAPNPEAATAKIIGLIKEGWLDPAQDIILSPKHGTGGDENDGGIIAINNAVMQVANPHGDGEKWKTGDRVIITKNFANDDLWNGDLGIITDVDWSGMPWVTLDRPRQKGPALLNKEQIKELKHAWCLSVHKSQGSQFRRVVFVCFKEHRYMLTRSLIYTAITRTKESCLVLGNLSAFYAGINRIENRTTVLQSLGGI